MKTYIVTITETLRMEVEVEASSRFDAELLVKNRWNNGAYILDADHLKGVTFSATPPIRERGMER